MVARNSESAAVRDFLERALGEPTILVVEGEAGIGKSTILSDATQAASARGFRVLSASGAPAEVSYAYAAVADLLAFVDGPVLAELPEAQRAALEHVLLGGSDGPAGNERMVASAFLAVIRRLSSDRPVLLCIDDTQWLDASSRAVIGFAARRLTGCTGLIVAVRTGVADSVDMSWLSASRPDMITHLPVAPLPLGGVHALVSARLGHALPRPVITRIYEISGGNPFFALELARFIAEDPARAAGGLPDTLAALVHDHIADLDEEVGAVLLAAACAASPTVQRVGKAVGITPERVVEVVESGQAGGVAEVDGDRVRFRHPLFASGVYSSAGPAARRVIHRRLAGIVEEPELTARHLALAATTSDPDTLAALDAGVEATVARGAPAVAAELLELAIKLGDDTPLRRMRAAEQHFRSGAVAPARAHLQSTLDALPEPSGLRCMALIALAAVTGYDSSLSTAADLLTQAVDQAADNPVLQLRARLLLVPIVALTRNLKESVGQARITVAQAEQLGIPALHSQALTTQAIVRFMHGLGVDEAALELARDLEDPASSAAVGYHASAAAPVIRSWTGDLDEAQKQIGAVQQRVLATGTEIDILWVADHATMNELWLGRYTEARAIADETVRRAEQMGAKMVLVFAWARQAAVAAHTGCVNDARSAAHSAIDMARAVGDVMNAASATATLGFLEVSLGDFAAAVTVLEPLLAAFDPDHDTEITIGGYLPDAIEALTALGRLDQAEPLVAALECNGVRHDRPWMLAVGARGRAHLLAARGELEAAEKAAEDALAHHDRLPMPFELARSQLVLGALQRRRRRKQAAEATLREALDTFERIGAPLWADRTRAEVARLAGPVGAGAGLTAAERRVAELAAVGLSNKQIAAELFIAAKTVEMNLSSVYRKLGIRSRAGLSAALSPG